VKAERPPHSKWVRVGAVCEFARDGKKHDEGFVAVEIQATGDGGGGYAAAGTGEVLIRVGACGICGSDVHGYDGLSGRRIPPTVMGHEAAGWIAAVGAGIKGLAEGDRVTFDSTIYLQGLRFLQTRRGESL
jgi:threonine dehydrogenase-like Zn-dependent dehydrogenase